MPSSSAPLLSAHLIEQTRAVADAIRRGEVAPLIGTGLSIPRGLPSWPDLVDRLILAWREWDVSSAARRLSAENYVRFTRQAFQSDLAVVSYLRNRIMENGLSSFGQLLYSALYAPTATPFTPDPSDVHRHLVQLFAVHPGQLWTTNYDDLLEEAAHSMDIPAATRDPARRRVSQKLTVAHLHGFLAPPNRAAGHPEPRKAASILTLAEDDFYAIARDLIGWTSREFYRLFDEYRVLILGMSLDDPNVRRILITSRVDRDSPQHFAVMRASSAEAWKLPRIQRHTRNLCTEDANEARTLYWRNYGVEVVDLPDYDTILPFLVRLRYESYGGCPGDLWREGRRHGYEAIHPWEVAQQNVGRLFLNEAVQEARREFSVPDDEIVEMGIFLLQPDGATLELTFRGGGPKVAQGGETLFSANPDLPTGVAGRVFVSGDAVRVRRDDPLHNYGLPAGERSSVGSYEGIVAAPLIDWNHDGIPLGVVYVTVATTSGSLFALPARTIAKPKDRTLDDLFEWLHLSTMAMLAVLRKMGQPG